jgi:hypothetical protein
MVVWGAGDNSCGSSHWISQARSARRSQLHGGRGHRSSLQRPGLRRILAFLPSGIAGSVATGFASAIRMTSVPNAASPQPKSVICPFSPWGRRWPKAG